MVITGFEQIDGKLVVPHTQRLSRKEAIARCKAMSGLQGDSTAQEMIEAILLACNQARKNETGKGYNSEWLDGIRRAVQADVRAARDAGVRE